MFGYPDETLSLVFHMLHEKQIKVQTLLYDYDDDDDDDDDDYYYYVYFDNVQLLRYVIWHLKLQGTVNRHCSRTSAVSD